MRLQFLDSTRGWAALYVLLFHLALLPDFIQGDLPSWCSRFILFGGSGVTLFMVASAFSLCLTMPRHLSKPHPMKSFYFSRFFRIAPLFYFMLFVTYIRDIFTFDVWHKFGVVLANILFVYNFIPKLQESYVWAAWTIGVEMVFYAIFPVIYFYGRSLLGRITQFFIFTILLLLISGWMEIGNFSFVYFIPVFVAGMISFELYEIWKDRSDAREIGSLLIAVGITGLFLLVLFGHQMGITGDTRVIQGLFFGSVILGAGLNPVGVIVNRITTFFGRISYSVYLIHAPIIYFLIPVYRSIYERNMNHTVEFVASVAVTLLVVVPIAMVLYRYVERPGIEFGRRLLSKQENVKAMT